MLENILYFRIHYLNNIVCGGPWCDAHSRRAARRERHPIGHVLEDGRGHPIGTRVRGKRTHSATCRGASSGLSSFWPQFSRNSHAISIQRFTIRADNDKSVIESVRSCFVFAPDGWGVVSLQLFSLMIKESTAFPNVKQQQSTHTLALSEKVIFSYL